MVGKGEEMGLVDATLSSKAMGGGLNNRGDHPFNLGGGRSSGQAYGSEQIRGFKKTSGDRGVQSKRLTGISSWRAINIRFDTGG